MVSVFICLFGLTLILPSSPLPPFLLPFPLQTYTDYVWSKGEHPKFTDIRSHWNNAIWTAREKVVKFVEDIKK